MPKNVATHTHTHTHTHIYCMWNIYYIYTHMKSSDAKASKCHLKFSSLMMIFIKLVYLIKEENFKWHLEAFASELFIYFMLYKSGRCLWSKQFFLFFLS